MPGEKNGSPEYQTATVGVAPLVKGILDCLGVPQTIDRFLKHQPEVSTTYGALAQVIIVNRMCFQLQALYQLGPGPRNTMWPDCWTWTPPGWRTTMWLHSPKRLAGLTLLIMLAVLVATLLEHQVRRWVRDQGRLLHGLSRNGRATPTPQPRPYCGHLRTMRLYWSSIAVGKPKSITPSSVWCSSKSGI